MRVAGEVRCDGCGRQIEDGERVTVRAERRVHPDSHRAHYELECDGCARPMSFARAALHEFHTHPYSLNDPGTNGHALRRTLHDEEHREVMYELEGIAHFGVTDDRRARLARELADQLYVTYGTGWAFRLDLDVALVEVHRAAMVKMRAGLRREDGKLRKPPGFVPPDMSGALR